MRISGRCDFGKTGPWRLSRTLCGIGESLWGADGAPRSADCRVRRAAGQIALWCRESGGSIEEDSRVEALHGKAWSHQPAGRQDCPAGSWYTAFAVKYTRGRKKACGGQIKGHRGRARARPVRQGIGGTCTGTERDRGARAMDWKGKAASGGRGKEDDSNGPGAWTGGRNGRDRGGNQWKTGWGRQRGASHEQHRGTCWHCCRHECGSGFHQCPGTGKADEDRRSAAEIRSDFQTEKRDCGFARKADGIRKRNGRLWRSESCI